MEMIFDANGKSTKLFSQVKKTNFERILNGIKNIKNEIVFLSYEEFNYIKLIFDKYVDIINEQLNKLYINNSNQPQLDTNYFIKELNKILNLVNESSINNYSYVYENTSITINEYNNLLSKIKSNEEEYIKSIKTNSNSNIENFISINKKNLDNLYNSWEEYIL